MSASNCLFMAYLALQRCLHCWWIRWKPNDTSHFVVFEIFPEDAIHTLRACLYEISHPFYTYSDGNGFNLRLQRIHVTPTILDLLVKILNRPMRKAPTGAATYWDHVHLRDCQISDRLAADNKGFCSQDSIQVLISALTNCPSSLKLSRSQDILECLFNTPHFERRLTELSIVQERFSALDCARIGSLVQRAVTWSLDIDVDVLEDPLVLGQGLANAFHLQSLRIKRALDPNFCDVLLRDGDCIVRLLLGPQSRLKELVLSGIGLTDRDLQLIVDMLYTSQLQALNLSHNEIGLDGILALAHQLPKIKCLKELDLRYNAFDDPHFARHEVMYEECINAVLQGMFENFSMEQFHFGAVVEEMVYLTKSHRISRQILATGLSLPGALWPLILELVGRRHWDPTSGKEVQLWSHRANALYFVLRNCPIIFCSIALTEGFW